MGIGDAGTVDCGSTCVHFFFLLPEGGALLDPSSPPPGPYCWGESSPLTWAGTGPLRSPGALSCRLHPNSPSEESRHSGLPDTSASCPGARGPGTAGCCSSSTSPSLGEPTTRASCVPACVSTAPQTGTPTQDFGAHTVAPRSEVAGVEAGPGRRQGSQGPQCDPEIRVWAAPCAASNPNLFSRSAAKVY